MNTTSQTVMSTDSDTHSQAICSASTKALDILPILEEIISYLHIGISYYGWNDTFEKVYYQVDTSVCLDGSMKSLHSCVLVSRLWSCVTIPQLWGHYANLKNLLALVYDDLPESINLRRGDSGDKVSHLSILIDIVFQNTDNLPAATDKRSKNRSLVRLFEVYNETASTRESMWMEFM